MEITAVVISREKQPMVARQKFGGVDGVTLQGEQLQKSQRDRRLA